jgi:hypothetical protein
VKTGIQYFKQVIDVWIPACAGMTTFYRFVKIDGSVKSPDAALPCIFRHCGVLLCAPLSSGLARLACELIAKPSKFSTFYGFIKITNR